MEKGDIAPDFCLPNQDGKEICLKDFRGEWVVLYFYLKDNTTGCTKEAVNFSENIEEFERLNAKIIGISPDSTKSHRNFINKHNLRVILLSDPEHKVLEKYEIWQLKKRCGKESYGVVRTTFLISPTGKVEKIWKNVKVDGHADDVKCQLQDIIE